MPEHKPGLAIIGCGSMGKAFAKALSPFYDLHLYNRTFQKAQELAREVQATAYETLEEALKNTETVILAFKPKDLASVSVEIEEALPRGSMVVSLLSTNLVSQLQEEFPYAPIVRMMPNIAAEHGQSMTALCDGGRLADNYRRRAEEIASRLGKYVWITEDLMPGFIALAGSGPAFHLAMIEAMVEAGIALGFKSDVALSIVLQSLKSTISILEEGGEHPGALRWKICTPAGTTIAGLMALEENNLRNAVIQTFLASAKRAGL